MNDHLMTFTDAELTATVEQISQAMRGPMSNFERACCHADRQALRAEQARRSDLILAEQSVASARAEIARAQPRALGPDATEQTGE